MSYSYSSPVSYGPAYPQVQTQENSNGINGSTVALGAGVAVGGIGGSIVGSRINPYVNKSGVVKDNFAQRVVKRYFENAEEGVKKFYQQSQEVLKKIGKVSNVEELRNLAREYGEAFKNTINLDHVNEKNLNDNIKTLRETITQKLNAKGQEIKNQVQACWNGEKKAFEKASTVTDDVYKAVEKSASGMRFKNMLKFGGLGAIALGATGFILHKVLSNRTAPKQ